MNLKILIIFIFTCIVSACTSKPFDSPNADVKKFTYYQKRDIKNIYETLFSDHQIVGELNKFEIVKDSTIYALAKKYNSNVVIENLNLLNVGPSQLKGKISNGEMTIYESVGIDSWATQYLFLKRVNNKKYFWEKELSNDSSVKSIWIQCGTFSCDETFGSIESFTDNKFIYFVPLGKKKPFARFSLSTNLGIKLDYLDKRTPYIAVLKKHKNGIQIETDEGISTFVPLTSYKNILEARKRSSISIY